MHKYDPGHVERLISEERRGELNPKTLLIDEGLKEGDAFADVGCGPGFFTFPGAELVGRAGTVYAVDTQEEMLRELRKRRPPENVKVVRSGENAVPIDSSAGGFFLLS